MSQVQIPPLGRPAFGLEVKIAKNVTHKGAGSLTYISELIKYLLWSISTPHPFTHYQTSLGEFLVSLRPKSSLLFGSGSVSEPHPQLLVEKAVQKLLKHHDDQSILLYGCPGSGKTAVGREVLRGLLASLSVREGLGEKIVPASTVLETFYRCDRDGGSGCSTVTALRVNYESEEITACEFSFLELDTEQLSSYRVFTHLLDILPKDQLESLGLASKVTEREGSRGSGVGMLEACLVKLGMTEGERKSLYDVLTAVLLLSRGSSLKGEEEVGRLLGVDRGQWDLGVKDAGLLYQHTVRWLGE